MRERSDIQSADILQLNVKVNDQERFTLLAIIYRFHRSLRADFTKDSLLTDLHGKNILYCGDINYNILNQDHDTDEYLGLLASKGLLSLINEPTRIVGNSATCLDHVFVRFFNNNGSYNFKAKVYHYNITDHSTVVCSIRFIDSMIKSQENRAKNIDMYKFCNELETVDWVNVLYKEMCPMLFKCL